MKERTFVLIKPDHVALANEIFSELDRYGNRIKTVNIESAPKEIVEDHYSPHKERSQFDSIVDYLVNEPIVIAIYEGEGIINKLMEIIGPTDPSNASKNTIRGKYSDDSLEKAIAENRHVKNVIHRSDSPQEAEREIKVWSKYLNQEKNYK